MIFFSLAARSSTHILSDPTFRIRPLSHGLSNRFHLLVFQVYLIGPSSLDYGVADVSGHICADTCRHSIWSCPPKTDGWWSYSPSVHWIGWKRTWRSVSIQLPNRGKWDCVCSAQRSRHEPVIRLLSGKIPRWETGFCLAEAAMWKGPKAELQTDVGH